MAKRTYNLTIVGDDRLVNRVTDTDGFYLGTKALSKRIQQGDTDYTSLTQLCIAVDTIEQKYGFNVDVNRTLPQIGSDVLIFNDPKIYNRLRSEIESLDTLPQVILFKKDPNQALPDYAMYAPEWKDVVKSVALYKTAHNEGFTTDHNDGHSASSVNTVSYIHKTFSSIEDARREHFILKQLSRFPFNRYFPGVRPQIKQEGNNATIEIEDVEHLLPGNMFNGIESSVELDLKILATLHVHGTQLMTRLRKSGLAIPEFPLGHQYENESYSERLQRLLEKLGHPNYYRAERETLSTLVQIENDRQEQVGIDQSEFIHGDFKSLSYCDDLSVLKNKTPRLTRQEIAEEGPNVKNMRVFDPKGGYNEGVADLARLINSNRLDWSASLELLDLYRTSLSAESSEPVKPLLDMKQHLNVALVADGLRRAASYAKLTKFNKFPKDQILDRITKHLTAASYFSEQR